MIKVDISGEGLIYLASPYSHEDEAVMHSRFQANCIVSARLVEAGVVFFAPIVQSVPISKEGGFQGTNWKAWARFDSIIVGLCKAIYVLSLQGWDTSVGVRAEIEHAINLDIPVYMLDGNTLLLTTVGTDYYDN